MGATVTDSQNYYDSILEKYADDETSSESNVEQPQGLNGQDESNSAKTESELSLEEQLKSLDVKPEEGAGEKSDILSALNELGITRDGTPVSFDNVDSVKELLSKGYDYTQKTQELANQRKEFEETFSKKEEEFNSRFEELQQFEQDNKAIFTEYNAFQRVLNQLSQQDPDVFSELQSAFEREMNSYNQVINNPAFSAVNEQVAALEKQIQELKSGKEKETHTQIFNSWESGLSDVQKEFGAKLSNLKVTPNWKAVQEKWESDATNKMTVKEAFFATHGEKLAKALEAFNKAQKTKSESDSRLGKRYAPEGVATNEKPDSRMDYLEKIAARHGF